jgi:hypothetical protein
LIIFRVCRVPEANIYIYCEIFSISNYGTSIDSSVTLLCQLTSYESGDSYESSRTKYEIKILSICSYEDKIPRTSYERSHRASYEVRGLNNSAHTICLIKNVHTLF